MKKKVLVISASPRKGGNSDLLCDVLIRGAQEAGKLTEKISLRDKNLHPCNACEICLDNGGICAQEDDMAEILATMIAADVIVMATPVYFYSMSAQIKMLIDRTYARYMEIRNKDFYFIVTAADSNRQALEIAIDGLRGFTRCLSGAKEKGVLYGTGVWKAGEVINKPILQQTYEVGRSL